MSAIDIVEYQPTWAEEFLRVAAELNRAVARPDVRIEHIGSTSVPGLCAKPILDILVGVASLADIETRIATLADLGYRYRPDYEVQIPGRRYFVKDATATAPRLHVHGVVAGSALWRDHVAFRDALRDNPQLAAEYGRLKRRLAARPDMTRSDYTEAKAPFIRRVLGLDVAL